MKKINIILAALLLWSYGSNAQWATSGSNIYNTNSGNVGIGINSPTAKLDIDGGSSGSLLNLRVINTSLGINAYVGSDTDFHGSAFIGRRSRGSNTSPTANVSNDRITGIYGSYYANGAYQTASAIQMYVGNSPSASSFPSNIRFETTATNSTTRLERMRISESGNIGIGNTSPSYLLDVSGTVQAVSYVTPSDKRLKININKIENPLNKIAAISGYTYNYDINKFKDRKLSGDKRYGFMAQEVQQVLPEVVATNADGYLSVDYVSIIPVLLESIKTLKAELDGLKDFYLTRLMEKEGEEVTALAKKSVLEQSSPNPSKISSNVVYSVPEEAGSASIIIYTLGGTLIKQYSLETKSGSIDVKTDDIQAGVYLYSLVIDGKGVKTKRLVVEK